MSSKKKQIEKLPGSFTLLSESFSIYKKGAKVFLEISFLIFIVGLVSFLRFKGPLGFIIALIVILASSLNYVSLIYLIKGKDKNIREAYGFAFSKIVSYWWVSLLFFFVILGGFSLLFVPGIVFLVWFVFAPIILISEDLRGFSALLKSREYVKGSWFSVAERVIFILAFAFLLFIIFRFLLFGLGEIFTLLFSSIIVPLVFIYQYLIYEYLKKIKGEFEVSNYISKRNKIITVSLIGIIILALFAGIFALVLIKNSHPEVRDLRRKVNISRISISFEKHYKENGKYPEIEVKKGRVSNEFMDSYIGDFPKDPGGGSIEGCNDIRGSGFAGFGNSDDLSKYCIYACLEEGGYFVASEEGIEFFDNPPKDLDCKR